jgi:hypothetical protein
VAKTALQILGGKVANMYYKYSVLQINVLQILGIINQRITNTKWQILQINVFEIKEYEDSRTVESKYIYRPTLLPLE